MVKTEYIPKVDAYMIGSMLLDTITEYYADPINKAKFEAWQQKRQKEKDARRELICS